MTCWTPDEEYADGSMDEDTESPEIVHVKVSEVSKCNTMLTGPLVRLPEDNVASGIDVNHCSARVCDGLTVAAGLTYSDDLETWERVCWIPEMPPMYTSLNG